MKSKLTKASEGAFNLCISIQDAYSGSRGATEILLMDLLEQAQTIRIRLARLAEQEAE